MRRASLSFFSCLFGLALTACTSKESPGDAQATGLGETSSSVGLQTATEDLEIPDNPGFLPLPAPNDGCEGIDFLVVVDNSRSMADEQEALIESFPGFLETIANAVSARKSNFHVLVTDTDSDGCEQVCSVYPGAYCGTTDGFSCNSYNPNVTKDCANTLGAGRVDNGLGHQCGLHGRRFIQSEDANVSDAFRCLGKLGTKGDSGERPMQAIVNALSPQFLSPTGCNQGFLRKEALLVLLFITDEEDDPKKDQFQASMGDPQDWYNAVVQAKGGDPGSVVAVGLVGDVGKPGAICQPLIGNAEHGAEASPRLIQFVELFGDRGRWGSVCASDYNPFLQEVVAVVTESCQEFIPPPE